jgi:hypothetical protein
MHLYIAFLLFSSIGFTLDVVEFMPHMLISSYFFMKFEGGSQIGVLNFS